MKEANLQQNKVEEEVVERTLVRHNRMLPL